MKTVTISSWPDLVKIADRTMVGSIGNVPYAFRGQSRAQWELRPSLLRCFDDGIEAESALEMEKMGLAEFKASAHLHLAPSVFATTTDTISWWTVMQQHGAPTRLLDWTASFYVAAYFAVHGNQLCDGAIWVIHINELHGRIDKGVGDSAVPETDAQIQLLFLAHDPLPVVTFVGRGNKSERMVAQQGLFSVCRSVIGDHGKIFERVFSEKHDKLHFLKVIVPANLKPLVARHLRSMNITANAMFPGIDGLGKSVAELIRLAADECHGERAAQERASKPE